MFASKLDFFCSDLLLLFAAQQDVKFDLFSVNNAVIN
jgi:hypothetical protein